VGFVSGSQQRPVSLAQARDAADRLWPGRDAKPSVWVAFHRQRAELFALAARTDPGHRHEAAYLASIEREEADRIDESMRAGSRTPGPRGAGEARTEDEGV
jgi:hypothetical protein